MIVIYGHQYEVSFEGHVFPVEKYSLISQALSAGRYGSQLKVVEPRKATLDELMLVHSKEYLDDLLNLRWTGRTASSELPLTRQIADFFEYTAGGSILAAKKAQEDGVAFHIGGGFHHAFSDHAEGFCYINDIAVAIKSVQADNPGLKVLVFDCDLHQGNGTAMIFENDPNVFTCSIHQENLYPVKQKSDLDIGLTNFANDEEYLAAVNKALAQVVKRDLDIAFYIAGADPYKDDKLGTLQITKAGLKQRDRLFFEFCSNNGLKVVVLLAGGYSLNTMDVVAIHVNTFNELCTVFI